ncbi:MAG: hypothetical protein D6754_14935 [Alphaproteobacteria bacterium]|nr:MAG: hypothetical protein D6754_14935 [Alphaproteobacteria bacterium]
MIRNRLAHLNMLWDAAKGAGEPDPAKARELALNLTREVTRTRRLMGYDRKLRNAVTKAVIGTLEREKIALSWHCTCHLPAAAHVAAEQAKHLKCAEIVEDLHDPAFLRMVAAVFDGEIVASKAASIETRPPDQRVGAIFARLRREMVQRNNRGKGGGKGRGSFPKRVGRSGGHRRGS